MWISALRRFSVLPVVLLLAGAGCDSGRVATYPVSGTVRFKDGQPVPRGTVEFREEETGVSARAMLDATGRFVLGTFTSNDGAPAGNYRVIVVQHFDLPPHVNDPRLRGAHFAHAHESNIDMRVADEVTDFSTSSLRAEVLARSKNEFDFVVQRSADDENR